MQFIFDGRIYDPVHGDMGEVVLYDWSEHFKGELYREHVDALGRWCDEMCGALHWKWLADTRDGAEEYDGEWTANFATLGGIIARGGTVLRSVLSPDCFSQDMAVLGRLQIDVACRMLENEHGPMGLNWERGWLLAREYASKHFNQTRIRACEQLASER